MYIRCEERSDKMDKIKICFECGSKNQYNFKDVIRKYKGDGYDFEVLVKVPFCEKCGAPIYVENVEREIAQKVNKEIRERKNIITREEILEILETYNVSQKFLSRLLGWGEITLTRYIRGNYTPNVANSNRLRELRNPYVFQMLLQDYRETNKEISEEKPLKKIEEKVCFELNKIEKTQGRMFSVVNWFLAQSSEEEPMTHLAMQKILYFVQSWSRVLLGEEIFEEDCQAWVHGAVYPKVYNMFKWFKYMPLPIVKTRSQFEDNELIILEAVKRFYFDVYSAKALEDICHKEEPYMRARKGYSESENCNKVIKKEDVLSYYNHIARKYDIKLENLSNIKEYLYCIRN